MTKASTLQRLETLETIEAIRQDPFAYRPPIARNSFLAGVQYATAVFDYVVAGPFAFPVLVGLYINAVIPSLHDLLGGAGTWPVFDPAHLMFLNMFGWFSIVWSTLRIVWRDQPLLALCDAVLRLYFATMMFVYLSIYSVSIVLYPFIASEVSLALLLLVVWFRDRRARPGHGI
jgi:hypothetical protein